MGSVGYYKDVVGFCQILDQCFKLNILILEVVPIPSLCLRYHCHSPRQSPYGTDVIMFED